MGHQAVFFHDADGFHPSPHGQGVAAKGGAVVARLQHGGRGVVRHDGPNGHARAQALGQRHHIGGDAGPLVGKPFAGAAHARLHFIQDQQPALGIAQGTHLLQVFLAHGVQTAFALDGLHHDGDDVGVALGGFL